MAWFRMMLVEENGFKIWFVREGEIIYSVMFVVDEAVVSRISVIGGLKS